MVYSGNTKTHTGLYNTFSQPHDLYQEKCVSEFCNHFSSLLDFDLKSKLHKLSSFCQPLQIKGLSLIDVKC